MNDRHAIITLKGRGGIGKTSAALAVIRKITETDRFNVILWFSARDIDLLTTGAKTVQPRVMSEKDIADLYCALLGINPKSRLPPTTALEVVAKELRENPHGPALYVFDNFETLRSPVDVFSFIDNNIRIPNKAIIITRFRDFKADFPIEVLGMEYDEASQLIVRTASQLSIEPLIGASEKNSYL